MCVLLPGFLFIIWVTQPKNSRQNRILEHFWRCSMRAIGSNCGTVTSAILLSRAGYLETHENKKGFSCARSLSLSHLHLVLRFWNHVLTCASVIFRVLARAARSALARYFCRWKRFSSSHICARENDVRGFFRLGGVRFWYGWPIRRATTVKGVRAAGGRGGRSLFQNRKWQIITC